MKKTTLIVFILISIGLTALYAAAFTVGQAEQAVIVRFGKVTKIVEKPGLHFKMPFLDEARKFEKRWLEWDGDPNQITTADKRYISIDVFARWRISDLNVFVEKLSNETRAQSRLDDIIDSATRNVIANHNLIEAIRTTDRQFVETDEELRAAGGEKAKSDAEDKKDLEDITKEEEPEKVEKDSADEENPDEDGEEEILSDGGILDEPVVNEPPELAVPAPTNPEMIGGAGENDTSYEIEVGRKALTRIILANASKEAAKLGIELKDVQIKRIDYIESVQVKVFDRMISERRRVAEAFRSQGQGLSAEILGKKERELRNIRSEAYRLSQEIKGKADGEAAGIYAKAYDKDPEFYQFLKTMESYEQTVDQDTWLLLTTDADYVKHMSEMKGN